MTNESSSFAVIYTDSKTGEEITEYFKSAQEANARLKELWGPRGGRDPRGHVEARAVLGSRVKDFSARG